MVEYIILSKISDIIEFFLNKSISANMLHLCIVVLRDG